MLISLALKPIIINYRLHNCDDVIISSTVLVLYNLMVLNAFYQCSDNVQQINQFLIKMLLAGYRVYI